MNKLAYALSQKFVTNNIISEKDIEIYRYGLEILLSSTFTSLSLLIVATLIDSFWYGVIYLLFTIPLRTTAGGYHADTRLKCFICSNLTYVCVSLFLRIMNSISIPMYCWLLLLYLGAFYIYLKAPVQNINHPISETKLKKNKKKATIFLLLDCFILSFLLISFPTVKIVQLCILSVMSVALLIIPTQMKGEGHK